MGHLAKAGEVVWCDIIGLVPQRSWFDDYSAHCMQPQSSCYTAGSDELTVLPSAWQEMCSVYLLLILIHVCLKYGC